MFRNICIKNFRGIKECSFLNFSRVNFFYGRNNSGKSTVLESLFLLSGISTPIILIRENSMRDYSRLSESDISAFFYNFDTEKEICFSAIEDAGIGRSASISTISKQAMTFSTDMGAVQEFRTNGTKSDFGLSYSFSVGDDFKKNVSMKIKENTSGVSVSIPRINGYAEKYVTVYLPPVFQFSVMLDKLAEIIKNKQKQNIINGLRIIEDGVKDIAILNNEVFVDIGLNQFVPLKLMGDGMKKILSILISVYTCNGGAVIVDEIDNGLHYSAISPLIRLISEACNRYNVQFFASTHSKEILDQIFNLSDINLSDFNFYTLYKKSGETESRCLNGVAAKKAHEQWGLEIR